MGRSKKKGWWPKVLALTWGGAKRPFVFRPFIQQLEKARNEISKSRNLVRRRALSLKTSFIQQLEELDMNTRNQRFLFYFIFTNCSVNSVSIVIKKCLLQKRKRERKKKKKKKRKRERDRK